MNSIKLLLSDLSSRSQSTELMGLTGSDELLLARTLKQFKSVNRFFSGFSYAFTNTIVQHMKTLPRKKFTILDIGAGGCDIALSMSEICHNNGIDVNFLCIDHDFRVVKYAQNVVRGAENITVVKYSARDALNDFKADYITSNHFLHHLCDRDIVNLIQDVSKASIHGFMFNDLKRSRFSMVGFFLISNIFYRRSFLQNDGLISIQKGFTLHEMNNLNKTIKLKMSIQEIPYGHLCVHHFKETF